MLIQFIQMTAIKTISRQFEKKKNLFRAATCMFSKNSGGSELNVESPKVDIYRRFELMNQVRAHFLYFEDFYTVCIVREPTMT